MTKHKKAKDLEALASPGAADESAANLSAAITTPENRNSESLPELVIDQADYPAAARELAVRLAATDTIYRRDSELIKIAYVNGAWSATTLVPDHLIVEAHKVCRPVERKLVGGEQRLVPTSLKSGIARPLWSVSRRKPSFRPRSTRKPSNASAGQCAKISPQEKSRFVKLTSNRSSTGSRSMTTSYASLATKLRWNKLLRAAPWARQVFAVLNGSGAPEEIRTPDP
ncbi:MAG: hypothetical protein ABSA13_11615 [Beijerinckiaceae bacterium]